MLWKFRLSYGQCCLVVKECGIHSCRISSMHIPRMELVVYRLNRIVRVAKKVGLLPGDYNEGYTRSTAQLISAIKMKRSNSTLVRTIIAIEMYFFNWTYFLKNLRRHETKWNTSIFLIKYIFWIGNAVDHDKIVMSDLFGKDGWHDSLHKITLMTLMYWSKRWGWRYRSWRTYELASCSCHCRWRKTSCNIAVVDHNSI